MAYTPHTLAVFGGRLNSATTPGEIFQCGVRFEMTGGSGSGPYDENLDDFCEAWAPLLADGYFTTANANIANLAHLDYVKVNNIDAAGHYADGVTHQFDLDGTDVGATGGQVPDFMCVAITWRTAFTRGRAHHGRIYPPNYAAGSAAAGSPRVGGSNITGIRTSGVALLDSLKGAAGTQDREILPSVYSALDGSHHAITGVGVGDVWDVQRRRKNAIDEVYSEVAYS